MSEVDDRHLALAEKCLAGLGYNRGTRAAAHLAPRLVTRRSEISIGVLLSRLFPRVPCPCRCSAALAISYLVPDLSVPFTRSVPFRPTASQSSLLPFCPSFFPSFETTLPLSRSLSLLSLSLSRPPSLSRSWIWTGMEDACAGRSLTRVHTTTHHVGIRPPGTFPELVSLEYPRRNHAITSHERRLFRRSVAQPDHASRSMAFQRGEENRRDPRWRCRVFCYKPHATSHDAHRQP